MARKLRCAVVGCGVIGPAHIESYQRIEDTEVVWACDLVEERAREKAEKYGIPKTTTDYREIMADPDVDAVSVCTDHGSHAEIAVAALDAGKHVLCEKALSAGAEGLDAMLDAHARKPDRVFSGVFQHRFDAVSRYMKRIIDDGLLGTLLTAGVQVRCLRTDDYYRSERWRGTWREEGGAVLINQAIHFIDLLVWTTGGVEALCGMHANLTHRDVMETEDTAVAALRFRKGALGNIEATCSSHLGWEPTLSYHGTDGAVELRGGAPLKIAFADEARREQVERELAECRDGAGAASAKDYYGPSHPTQIADFLAAVREGREPFVSARSARHTVDVVQAIYRSERERAWVDIPTSP